MSRLWLALAAGYGLLAVLLGAFGAHALKHRLAPDLAAVYRTAVEYHFWHALALLGIGVLALSRPSASLNVAGAAMAAGIVLFSGSLYLLALTGARGFGAVTPVGGLLLAAGWAALLWSAVRSELP